MSAPSTEQPDGYETILRRAVLNSDQDSKSSSGVILFPFVPRQRQNDGEYVRQLLYAVENPAIKNIALTGDYGTGKSSILASFQQNFESGRRFWRRAKRIQTISFLNLNIKDGAIQTSAQEDKSGQSTIDTMPNSRTGAYQGEPVDRLLQREVFKQLFFSINPRKIPRSVYRRTGKSFLLPALCATLFIVDIITSLRLKYNLNFLSFVISATAQLDLWPWFLPVCDLMILMAILFCLSNKLFSFLYDHPVKTLSVENLGVDLAERKLDFEQTLDTIIYIFKHNGKDVIIFEDLDRFDSIAIYEDLRQLNIHLNEALGRKITFIYALRDDILPDLKDRTKLFDLIIPVLPFLNVRNASSVVRQSLADAGILTPQERDGGSEPINQVCKIIGKYAPDMRSIRSICNDAAISYKLVLETGLAEVLKKEELIAMSALREIFPTEYANMRKGKGILAGIYSGCEALREESLANKQDEIFQLDNLEANVSLAATGLWKKWENELEEHQRSFYLMLDNKKLSSVDSFGTMDVFQSIQAGNTLVKHIKDIYGNIEKHTYDKNNLGKYTDLLVAASKGREKLQQELHDIKKRDVLQANFKEVKPLEINDANIQKIIQELIASKILDENYLLYLSPPSNEVTSRVSIFQIKYMKREKANYSFNLSAHEVATIMLDANTEECPLNPAFFNYDIVAWAVNNRREDILERMVYLAENRNSLLEFIQEWHRRVRILRGIDVKDPILQLAKEAATVYPVGIMNRLANNKYFRALRTSAEDALTKIAADNICNAGANDERISGQAIAFLREKNADIARSFLTDIQRYQHLLVDPQDIDVISQIFLTDPVSLPFSSQILLAGVIEDWALVNIILISSQSPSELCTLFSKMRDSELRKLSVPAARPKLPNNETARNLINKLAGAGFISSTKETRDGIIVYMKRNLPTPLPLP